MRTLSLDIETYSSADLITCGVYRYVEVPDFEVLMLAYAFDDEEVMVVDLSSGEKLPLEVMHALGDETVIKAAFNAQFERVCLSKHFNLPLAPEGWECTAVKAATLSLPASLENVAIVLKLEQGKMSEGRELIRYFCIPCTPTKVNGGRRRNLPIHAPEKWEQFKKYCIRDVQVERNIRKKLSEFMFLEQELYCLDQRINDTGVLVDKKLVENAIALNGLSKDDNMAIARKLTGLNNPNSVAQLKQWLSDNGLEVDSLSKKTVTELAKEHSGDIGELLDLRLRMSKTSVQKYEAIKRSVCSDGRVRGLLQFAGANRTARWAGRILQIQNLPQNHLKDLELAREIVKSGDDSLLGMLFDSVPAVLSELIRTALIPQSGSRFIVADYSSVERVVLAWIAGEKWVLDTYIAKNDLYIATASQMFNVPIEQIDKKNPLRQKGKVADLACIAKGQQVLTNKGLVPIEDVTTKHSVWDGDEWVTHEGVMFRGERETVCVDGVICTADHLILTSQGWIESGKCSGFNWSEVRSPHGTKPNGKQPSRKGKVVVSLRLWFRKGLRFLQSFTWKHKFLRLFYVRKNYGARICIKKDYSKYATFSPSLVGHEESVFFTRKPILAHLRRARNYGRRKMAEFRVFQRRYVGIIRAWVNNRPNRWQRGLYKKQLPVGYEEDEQSKFTQRQTLCHALGQFMCSGDSGKVRLFKGLHTFANQKRGNRGEIMAPIPTGIKKVYDLMNCGKRNRFTVWNGYRLCLVHNCGYGGSVGALKAMGALEMGVSESELQGLVNAWRKANPNIVKYWWDIGRAVELAVTKGKATTVGRVKIGCSKVGGERYLMIILPSGRRLCYFHPSMQMGKFDKDSVTYEGITAAKKWGRIDSYGPKFVENIVQAVARDLLAEALLRLDKAGYKIVMHIHDEAVAECPLAFGSVEEMCEIMAQAPTWADGLPLNADGYECSFYKKE